MLRTASKEVRVAVVAGAGLVALGFAGATWRGAVAGDHWREALGEVRSLEARLDANVSVRPALWGETLDGRAQPHYDRALSLVAGWETDAVMAALRAEDHQARIERAKLVADGAEALEALHRGAHAADAARTVDWSLGFDVPMRKLMRARILTRLCEMKAAILLEEGRELEAVGILLDALQFAGDLAEGPLLIEEMVGLALLPNTLVEGVSGGILLALPEPAQRRLESGVSALDRRLGWRVASLEGELVLFARALEAMLRDENAGWHEFLGERAGLGLAQRQMFAAEHVNAMRGLCARFDRASATGPGALLEEIDRLRPVATLEENPISARVLPAIDSAYRARLHSLGRFRLLAQAISAADPPRDPWLARWLRVEETGEGTRLWLDHEAFKGVEVHAAR